MTPDDPRHGAYAGYIAGCRTECCRAAARTYQRQRYFDRAVLGLDPRLVDRTGTVRRVQALQRIGWSAEELSLMLGKSRAYLNVTINRHGRTLVNRATALSVAELYERLCMTPGPSALTRRRAQDRGWPPPLAWDDIDNPAERPDRGYRPVKKRTADELLAEWAHLRSLGVSIDQAAQQLGVQVEAIERAGERSRSAA